MSKKHSDYHSIFLTDDLDVGDPSNWLADDDGMGDIAYWHPVKDLSDKPQPGDIVAIRDSYVSKVIDGPSMLSIIPFPNMPWKQCKVPRTPEDRQKSVQVTYLGEVAAKIHGLVELQPNCDHFVLVSGNHDGYGVIKAAQDILPEDYGRIVGKVVRTKGIRVKGDTSFVPTMVCINFSAVGMEGLSNEVSKLSNRVVNLEKKVFKLTPICPGGERVLLAMSFDLKKSSSKGLIKPSQPFENVSSHSLIQLPQALP